MQVMLSGKKFKNPFLRDPRPAAACLLPRPIRPISHRNELSPALLRALAVRAYTRTHSIVY